MKDSERERAMNNELYHHGILGQKWGIHNGPPYPLSYQFSEKPPKYKTDNGDYVYSKGSIFGHFGEGSFRYPIYLYTNQKDRDIYKKYLDRPEEHIYRSKKNIKIPNEVSQIVELYKYTKDEKVLENPYEYWKDNINQGGKISDGFIKHMKIKGYDALVDIRNAGIVSEDPILLLEPKKFLKEV